MLEDKKEILILKDHPLKELSSYKIGGNAQYYTKVHTENEVIRALKFAREMNLKVFILGGGSNILISDKGVSGLTIDSSGLNAYVIEEGGLKAQSGVETSELAVACSLSSLKGMENFFSMPGRIGGGVYMNSRCYGREFSDILKEVRYIDLQKLSLESMGEEEIKRSFKYKISPFQDGNKFILDVVIKLEKSNREELLKKMEAYKADRTLKGHFDYPSCGSVFKNNECFGEPMGQVIEKMGLKGESSGGASVSMKHGNFIINKNNASSDDVKELIYRIKNKIKEKFFTEAEEEVIYVGDF